MGSFEILAKVLQHCEPTEASDNDHAPPVLVSSTYTFDSPPTTSPTSTFTARPFCSVRVTQREGSFDHNRVAWVVSEPEQQQQQYRGTAAERSNTGSPSMAFSMVTMHFFHAIKQTLYYGSAQWRAHPKLFTMWKAHRDCAAQRCVGLFHQPLHNEYILEGERSGPALNSIVTAA